MQNNNKLNICDINHMRYLIKYYLYISTHHHSCVCVCIFTKLQHTGNELCLCYLPSYLLLSSLALYTHITHHFMFQSIPGIWIAVESCSSLCYSGVFYFFFFLVSFKVSSFLFSPSDLFFFFQIIRQFEHYNHLFLLKYKHW